MAAVTEDKSNVTAIERLYLWSLTAKALAGVLLRCQLASACILQDSEPFEPVANCLKDAWLLLAGDQTSPATVTNGSGLMFTEYGCPAWAQQRDASLFPCACESSRGPRLVQKQTISAFVMQVIVHFVSTESSSKQFNWPAEFHSEVVATSRCSSEPSS